MVVLKQHTEMYLLITIDHDELVDSITSYVKFCEETVINTKSVHVYPNKPWVTKDIKVHLNQTKLAFLKGKKEECKEKGVQEKCWSCQTQIYT